MSYVLLNWTALSEMVYNEIKYIDISEIYNLFIIIVVKDCSVDVMCRFCIDLFASLVWNVAGYVAGIRVVLEDGGLLRMGWSVVECLHWSVGVWLLEYSH